MSRRRWWVIGGGVAAVLLASGAWLLVAMRPPSPEDAAAAYVRALESADPSAVEATGVDVSSTALTAFTAAGSFIEGAEVTKVRRDGDTATVEISFRLVARSTTHNCHSLSRPDVGWSTTRGVGRCRPPRRSARPSRSATR